MGIVSFLLIIAAGCTGIATLIKAINNASKDNSPKIGEGFFESFSQMLKDAFSKE